MTEYFVPKSGMITVAGKSQRLIRGLHEVSDPIADSREAIVIRDQDRGRDDRRGMGFDRPQEA